MKHWVKALLVSILFSFLTPVSADGISRASMSILAIQLKVMDENGYIDKDLHDQLWANINEIKASGLTDASLMEKMQRIQTVTSRLALFPRESWKSAKLSYEAKKVIRTQGLDEQEEFLRKNYNHEATDQMIMSTRQLLEEAAAGKPYKEGSTSTLMNDEFIDKKLTIMDMRHDRVERLMNPVWDDTPKLQEFPTYGFTIKSADILRFHKTLLDGLPVYISGRLPKNGFEQIQVSFVPDENQLDVEISMTDACNATFELFKATCFPENFTWKGLSGIRATALLSPDKHQGQRGITYVVIKRPEKHLEYIILTVNSNGIKASNKDMDDLLGRIEPI
ncbi:hypothetical protein ACI2KR_26900 [Pseudomonas luteola]